MAGQAAAGSRAAARRLVISWSMTRKCGKVHDRVLRPLMTGDQPQAPPPLSTAPG
ncbi:MAG: hypothetical protein ACRDOK_10980 [Streptosporangiaceae bacterium]